MAQRNRQRMYWGVLLALLVLDAAVYFFWVRPARHARLDPGEVAALEREVERLETEVARLERIERALPRATRELDGFVQQHFVPAGAGSSALVSELERAAAEAGVRAGRVDFHPRPVRDRPELTRLEITTTVEGSYANLLRFLDALERSGNFCLLDRLSLVAGTRGGSLKLDLGLTTYLRRTQG